MRKVAGRQLKNSRPIKATAKTTAPAQSTIKVVRFIMNLRPSRERTWSGTRRNPAGSRRMLVHDEVWRYRGRGPQGGEKAGMLNRPRARGFSAPAKSGAG